MTSQMRDGIGVCGLLAVIAGFIVVGAGYQRQNFHERGSHEPWEVTVADLAKIDKIENVHVYIRDIEFGEKTIIETTNGLWNAVTFAAFPRGQKDDENQLRVLVRSTNVRTQDRMNEFGARTYAQGIIVNGVYSFDKVVEQFKKTYPNAKSDRLLVVYDGMTYPPAREIYLWFGSGGALIGLGACAGYIRFAAPVVAGAPTQP